MSEITENCMGADDFATVFNGLLFSANEEASALYQRFAKKPLVTAAARAAKEGDAETFYYSILYPMSKLVDGLLEVEIANNDEVHFILKHSQFLLRHFERIIKIHEGSVCCGDKSRWIIDALLYHFMTGKTIVFDRNVEHSYHLPNIVFDTHDNILIFFHGLYNLYHGEPEAYIRALMGVLRVEPGVRLLPS